MPGIARRDDAGRWTVEWAIEAFRREKRGAP
jgi:hypothetical protein